MQNGTKADRNRKAAAWMIARFAAGMTVYIQNSIRTDKLSPRWARSYQRDGEEPIFVDRKGDLRMRSGNRSVVILLQCVRVTAS